MYGNTFWYYKSLYLYIHMAEDWWVAMENVRCAMTLFNIAMTLLLE